MSFTVTSWFWVIKLNMWSIMMHLLILVIMYFCLSLYGSPVNHWFLQCTNTHIGTCDAALLGLMVMCFMSVPCCGCVSQTVRLTNCSILLNVRVMEAINGSELIAITHLAPSHCALPFTISPEDLLLSRSWISCRCTGRPIVTEL